MAIHVQDPEADRLLREFARRRNLGLTEAIKIAVAEAEAAQTRRVSGLQQRVAPLVAEVREAMRRNGTTPQDLKRFLDEGWDGL